MVRHTPIKVIKRDERERLEGHAAGIINSESSANEKAREIAATVKEWIDELSHTRLAEQMENKRRLGWAEIEGNGLSHQ
jgi:hypothetical protein